jgi:hypothetical protein
MDSTMQQRTCRQCGPRTGKPQTGQSAWGIVIDMSPKIPSPKDITAAAQAAAETAQSVASGAMRIPPASIQLASQLPDLMPQLEALVATGNDVYNAVASVPGVSTLSRLATRGAAPTKNPSRGRTGPKKT